MSQTLLLSLSEVQALLDTRALVEELRKGFIWYSTAQGERAHRVRASLPGPGSATVLFPGTVDGLSVYTVKVHAKFPAQQPAIRGILCVHSVTTGELLAVMDSTYITAVRTGIAGALAAHTLSRPEADSVAIIGAGAQGRQQLRALAALRPIRRLWVYDIVADAAARFCSDMSDLLGAPLQVSHSVEDAVRHADIVLMATWSRTPIILPGMLRPGAHVTSLGPDEPGKIEVSEAVLQGSAFFCDDAALAAQMGALASTGLTSGFPATELGEVLGGRHPGRTSLDQTTVYGGVGLAFQDAVCAHLVYERAIVQGKGRTIDFLA